MRSLGRGVLDCEEVEEFVAVKISRQPTAASAASYTRVMRASDLSDVSDVTTRAMNAIEVSDNEKTSSADSPLTKPERVSLAFRPSPVTDKARRRARWSRNPDQLRHARVQELERELAASKVLDGDGDESDSWRSRTDSEELTGPLELSGFLVKKSGAFSGLKRRFFVLSGGTLLWYKSEKDACPAGFCHLADARILDHSAADAAATARRKEGSKPPSPQEHGATGTRPFVVRVAKEYVLWADDDDEREKWLRALRHNRQFAPLGGLRLDSGKEVSGGSGSTKQDGSGSGSIHDAGGGRNGDNSGSPSSKDNAKAVKRSLLSNLALRAEKKMVGRAVTTDLGKKLLRECCQPETFILLQVGVARAWHPHVQSAQRRPNWASLSHGTRSTPLVVLVAQLTRTTAPLFLPPPLLSRTLPAPCWPHRRCAI